MRAREILPFNHLRTKMRFFRVIPQMLITLRVPTITSASVSTRTFLEACSSWQRPFASYLVSPSLVTLNPNQRSSHITHFPKRGMWPQQPCVHTHSVWPFAPCGTRVVDVVWFTLCYCYTAQQMDCWIRQLFPVKHCCCGQLLDMLQRWWFNSLACNQEVQREWEQSVGESLGANSGGRQQFQENWSQLYQCHESSYKYEFLNW